jgi:hypothetical protein
VTNEELVNKNYGADFQKHLLEQYKLYVETSLDVTSKRLESNKFYLTLNSIIFGTASYLTIVNQHVVIILLSTVGLIVSVIWIQSIASYKELNTAKFKVIHELEQYMPACLFKCEQKHYSGKRKGFASTEKWCPTVFIVLYCAIIALAIVVLLFPTLLPLGQ